MEMTP
jgi:hypothetical protein